MAIFPTKVPLKKSIYSLLIIHNPKIGELSFLDFIPFFDDHSSSIKKLDDINCSQKEKEHSYRGFNFFDFHDLSVLKAIIRGEYMTFRMSSKNICQHLSKITLSAIARFLYG